MEKLMREFYSNRKVIVYISNEEGQIILSTPLYFDEYDQYTDEYTIFFDNNTEINLKLDYQDIEYRVEGNIHIYTIIYTYQTIEFWF